MAFYQADPATLTHWFQSIDRDGSGQLNVSEIQRALHKGGLTFSLKMIQSIVGIFS